MEKCVCDCPHTKCWSIPTAAQEENASAAKISAVDSPVLRRPVFERVLHLGQRLAHVASDTARDDASAFPDEPCSTAHVGQVTSIQAVCRVCSTNLALGTPGFLIPWIVTHVHSISTSSCICNLGSEEQLLTCRPFDKATYKKRYALRQYCNLLF